MMRKKALALSLAFVCIAAAVIAGNRDDPLDETGQKQWPEKAKTIYAEMTCEAHEPDGDGEVRSEGTVKVWLDPGRGLYRVSVAVRMVTRNKEEDIEIHFVLTPKEAAGWRIEDGSVDETNIYAKTKPGQPPILENGHHISGLLIPFAEAAFGYKRIKKELVMEKAKSPLPQPDKLKWHEVKPKNKENKTPFFKCLALSQGTRVWLGLSPKTGWPMQHVIRSKNDGEAVFKVTKLDLKANLKGAFAIPADVKAKLDGAVDENPDAVPGEIDVDELKEALEEIEVDIIEEEPDEGD